MFYRDSELSNAVRSHESVADMADKTLEALVPW